MSNNWHKGEIDGAMGLYYEAIQPNLVGRVRNNVLYN